MLSLKSIDFSTQNITDKQVSLNLNEVATDSPKTLAYVLRWQLARRRAGSAKTKTMAEISGTTAKPWKQKGTGRARQGSRRSVQFVGGRTCFGPMPRSFDFSMPKKIATKGVAAAFKAKLADNNCWLFSNSATEQKTSKLNLVFKKDGMQSALIVFDFLSPKGISLSRSLRNLKHIKALDYRALNAYDIIKFDKLLVDEGVFEQLAKRIAA